MSVGEIEGDLDVFVGILNHDDAVVVNVCALPFALEEDYTTRLHFSRSKLGRLKNETALAMVRGVVGDLADFAAGSPDVMKLPVSRQRQTRLMALSVLFFVAVAFHERCPFDDCCGCGLPARVSTLASADFARFAALT